MTDHTSTVTASVEPEAKFDDVATDLASADQRARSLSEDAKGAKAERGVLAVSAIRSAHSEKLDPGTVRVALLAAGVLKGTVSKIATVLAALYAGEIALADVTSLNGSYSRVKLAEKIAAGTAVSTKGAPRVVSSPKEALEVLINTLSLIDDPDEALVVAGEYLTQITTGITDFTKRLLAEIDEDEDE